MSHATARSRRAYRPYKRSDRCFDNHGCPCQRDADAACTCPDGCCGCIGEGWRGRPTLEHMDWADPASGEIVLGRGTPDAHPYPSMETQAGAHQWASSYPLEAEANEPCLDCEGPTGDGEGWDGRCGDCSDRQAAEIERACGGTSR